MFSLPCQEGCYAVPKILHYTSYATNQTPENYDTKTNNQLEFVSSIVDNGALLFS